MSLPPKDKARILVFSPWYSPHLGGLENHAEQFNRELVNRGYTLLTLTPRSRAGGDWREAIDQESVVLRFPALEPIAEYPMPALWRQRWQAHWREARAFTPDLVISRTRFFATTALAYWYSRRNGIPWLHIEHGADYVQFDRPLTKAAAYWYDRVLSRFLLRRATRIVANSKASARFAAKLSGRGDVQTVYRGVEQSQLASITSAPRPAELSGKTIIAYVGRLIEGKGIPVLFQALAALPRGRTHAYIIGDGPQRRELQALVKKLDLERDVTFFSQQLWRQTMAYLKSADICVNPSYSEGLPTSLIEAALAGTPIVATDVGGTSEIITHNESGLLVPRGDTEALRAALAQLIANPAQRAQLAETAQQTVRQKFKWEDSIQQYESIFANLLKAGGEPHFALRASRGRPGVEIETGLPAEASAKAGPATKKIGAQYLFRLDDICPTMKWERFLQLVALFDRHGITPILGVVPDNQDPRLMVNPPRADFWSVIKGLQQRGWIIAQHGYQHRYVTADAGMLGLRARSEFAGLPYAEQFQKISAGKIILTKNLGQPATWWTAPAHSFDEATCHALRELEFTHVSDGIALYPFERAGLTWIPHQLWQPTWQPFGVWTVGIHLNTMSDQLSNEMAAFLERRAEHCRVVSLEPRQHALNTVFQKYWYAKFKTESYVRN